MILRELKNQTQEDHTQVEERLDLMNRELTLEHYVWVLEKLYGFYRPLERSLEQLPDVPPLRLGQRAHKSERILEDLRHLRGSGYDPTRLLECADLPRPEEIAEALGCMYVIEGATLGGRVITRHVRQTLRLSDDSGAVFFAGYGTNTEVMWREFQQYLLNNTDSEMHPAIVDSAKQTFSKLLQWLQA